ncbi:MAG: hypothetical protein ACRBBR_13335 [Cellvibrionaceae bacterium]
MVNERKEPTFSASSGASANTAQSNPKRAAAAARPAQPKVVVQKQSSGFLWFTFLIALATAAGVGYLFLQLQTSQQTISVQQERIDELENKLLLTGDESTQSLTVLTSNLKTLDKDVKLAMAEVDKLWATRKANLKEIAKVKASSSKELKEGLSKANSSIDALESSVKQPIASLEQRTGEQELLIQSLRERLSAQSKTTQSLSKQIKQYASATKQVKTISSKVDGYEETIRSFDKFRVTTNRDLLLLKERAGILSTPAR